MNNNINIKIDFIIEEYTNYAFKIVNNLAGPNLSYEDKEEILSDSFYLLWKNQNKIQNDLKSYLAAIIRNNTIKRLKTNNLNIEFEETDLNYSIKEDIDSLIIIKEQLKKLEPEELSIFNLFYVDGLKIKEISKILKLTPSNIKIKLFRIRKKLKEEFQNE